MLFDDPSSSSPAVGDARAASTDSRPRAAAATDRAADPRQRVASDPWRRDAGHEPAESRERVGSEPWRRDAGYEPAEPRERDAIDAAPDPRLIETAGAPEPEALRATTIASAVVRELYETGREVRFAFVPTRERVTVLLCDMDGAVLSRLTPARALEIATGEPIPGGRRR
jgi:hypothetical protein